MSLIIHSLLVLNLVTTDVDDFSKLIRIRTQHGSFSQEKALVTGFEAANATLDFLGRDKSSHRDIISVEEDEVHIKAARYIYRTAERIGLVLNPLSGFFMS